MPSILRANSSSVPSSPSNSRHASSQCQKPNLIKQDLAIQGYTPSSVYQTQTSYRSQQYPTFSMRSPSSYSSASSSDYGNYGDKTLPITPLSAPYRNRLVCFYLLCKFRMCLEKLHFVYHYFDIERKNYTIIFIL